jgi:hypothetical protein
MGLRKAACIVRSGGVMKKGIACVLLLLATLILASGCEDEAYYTAMVEALDEWPGACSYRVRPDEPPCSVESIEVLQSQEIAGGVVLIYRAPLETAGTYVLARTFLTPSSSAYGSWQPRASCDVVYDQPAGFLASWCPGGDVRALATVYGLADRGDLVRVEWSDGRVDTLPLVNGSFAQSRPSHEPAERVELLRADGAVLESRELD